jgi:hypothetical protein
MSNLFLVLVQQPEGTTATPAFSEPGGDYSGVQTIYITCSTPSALIYYTTNGLNPTTASTAYNATTGVSIGAGETQLQAIAIAVNYLQSQIESQTYNVTVGQVATPTFSPPAGTYSSTQDIQILCSTSGATIYYTTDGSAPNTSSPVFMSSDPIVADTADSPLTLRAFATATGLTNSATTPANVFTITGSGGASLQFNFPSFTAANIGTSPGQINLPGKATLNGSSLQIISDVMHTSGNAWYVTPQTITSFTCNFTFSINSDITNGLTFTIQNSNESTQDNQFGPHYEFYANADANCMSFGTYSSNPDGSGIFNSIAIGFTGASQVDIGTGNPPITNYGYWSLLALYCEAAPLSDGAQGGMIPQQDLAPFGINVSSGNLMSANVVYDGAILTLVLKDTVVGAQARFQWPIDIPIHMQGNGIPAVNTGTSDTAYIGFGASNSLQPGLPAGANATVYSWAYYTGYNARLATPTFSLPSGEYSSGQTFTISVPSGSTVYYTTNGLLPTSASTKYTAGSPITLTANTCIQAVAIQAGFTDSYVASANYSVGTANVINYTSFAANDGIVCCGNAFVTGGQLQITTTAAASYVAGGLGAAHYGTAVPITGNWSTTFQLEWGAGASGNGVGFLIHNPDSTVGSTYINNSVLSGGPMTLLCSNLIGYGTRSGPGTLGLNTGVLIFFDLNAVPNSVGLYHPAPTTPTGNQIVATGITFSGNTINVTLSYNASMESLSININSGAFTHTWSENIPTLVDASAFNNSAYVGFCGFCGGDKADQYVNSWSMT